MTTIRLWLAALALPSSPAFAAQPALADEAASIYDPSKVVFIDLTLSPTAKKRNSKPNRINTSKGPSPCRGVRTARRRAKKHVVDLRRPVEVRLKGNVGGSFRPLERKGRLQAQVQSRNAVLGLRKMTLNNMVQDPSMIHETLPTRPSAPPGCRPRVPATPTSASTATTSASTLTSKTSTKSALARIFGSFDKNTQHLYEGEDGHDVVPGEASGLRNRRRPRRRHRRP